MRSAWLLGVMVLAGCGGTTRKPPLEFIADMDRQPKFRAQGETDFFPDRRMTRPPVPGTVARGAPAADALPQRNPWPLSLELLERGRERYDIYCAPCHDRTGSGRGIVALRGAWAPADLREARLRQAGDGEIFATITQGKRTMPAYRFQIPERDRWAIVAYLRALQRAASATLDDVPPELRSQLR